MIHFFRSRLHWVDRGGRKLVGFDTETDVVLVKLHVGDMGPYMVVK